MVLLLRVEMEERLNGRLERARRFLPDDHAESQSLSALLSETTFILRSALTPAQHAIRLVSLRCC